MAIGIFFRFYNLDHKVFWEDEILGAIHSFGYTEAEIVAASPRLTDASGVQRYLSPDPSLNVTSTIGSLAAEDPQHPPTYYLITHVWTRYFGGSVESLRMPAAIFGVIALPCVFWLALELFGSLRTALIAVALVAVSPFFVLYSQEAREYSMWTAVVALNGAIFLKAIRSNAVVMWIGYSVITTVALYIYPLTGLVAIGLAAYLFIKEGCRFTRTMVACILADLAALALFAPWAKVMMTSRGLERGMAAILTDRLSTLQIARIFARDIRFLFFDIGSAHSTLDAAFTLIAIALSVYAMVALIRTKPYATWGFVVVGLCLSMAPLLAHDLLFHGRIVYNGRYFLPLLLGVELAAAALFDRVLFGRFVQSSARAAFAVVLAVVFAGELFSCAVASQATTWWNKDDERAPSVAVLVNRAPAPLVVSDYFTPTILELSLYLDPNVPVRLNLKCAQCISPVHGDVAFATAGYRSVFAVQATGAGSPRYLWVNPVPFPHQPDKLNMFTAISPIR